MVCETRQRSRLACKVRSPSSNTDRVPSRCSQDESRQVPSLLNCRHSHLGHHTHLLGRSRRPKLRRDCSNPGRDPATSRLRRYGWSLTRFAVSRKKKPKEEGSGPGPSHRLTEGSANGFKREQSIAHIRRFGNRALPLLK